MRLTAEQLHRLVMGVLVTIMVIEGAAAAFRGQILTSVLVALILAVSFAPVLMRQRMWLVIPAEFQILAVLFVFASLFLGEVQRFYERIWWWDIALHTTSGLLLGLVGFLMIYVLNETDRISLRLKPNFVALFAFVFALAIGAAWEIFEFSMDRLTGTTMQKPMFGDPSGLTDTMWDLIVDALGALIISITGWIYMRRRERTFIQDWIDKFIEVNPRLFTRS